MCVPYAEPLAMTVPLLMGSRGTLDEFLRAARRGLCALDTERVRCRSTASRDVTGRMSIDVSGRESDRLDGTMSAYFPARLITSRSLEGTCSNS